MSRVYRGSKYRYENVAEYGIYFYILLQPSRFFVAFLIKQYGNKRQRCLSLSTRYCIYNVDKTTLRKHHPWAEKNKE